MLGRRIRNEPLLLDRAIDAGLAGLSNEATDIYVCSQVPTNYVDASVTYALGYKTFGAGNAFAAPAAGTPSGQIVTSTLIGSCTVDNGPPEKFTFSIPGGIRHSRAVGPQWDGERSSAHVGAKNARDGIMY
jgi:hypothetical protein